MGDVGGACGHCRGTLLDWRYVELKRTWRECPLYISYTRSSIERERVYRRVPQLAFEDAGAFLGHLVNPAFVAAQLVPLLAHVPAAHEPYIAFSYGARERATCLQVFVWLAGAATQIHDHTSWGAYYCVVGSLLEQRY